MLMYNANRYEENIWEKNMEKKFPNLMTIIIDGHVFYIGNFDNKNTHFGSTYWTKLQVFWNWKT
jgi:hypothetical protein